jgi:hypothetical protein
LEVFLAKFEIKIYAIQKSMPLNECSVTVLELAIDAKMFDARIWA